MGFENIFLQLPMGNEWIILIVVAVVFIFGAKKIPELAKTFGKAKGEFEKGKIEGEKELKDFKDKEVKSD
jgi:sec-independent protein translocase protein TatA